jgi:hypothetical protein
LRVGSGHEKGRAFSVQGTPGIVPHPSRCYLRDQP